MFWDQLQRQIEHSGDSCISEICTKSFWKLGTSILQCHFYYHHINIFPKRYRSFFFTIFEEYISPLPKPSVEGCCLSKTCFRSQSERFVSSKCPHFIQMKLCMFPQKTPSPSYLARVRDLQESERLHLFLIQIAWDINRIADFGLRTMANV